MVLFAIVSDLLLTRLQRHWPTATIRAYADDTVLVVRYLRHQVPKLEALFYEFVCSFGSLFGAIIGYLIGQYLWWNGDNYSNLALFFFNYLPGFTENMFESIRLRYEEYNFIIILTAGFTPIPFKIFTIISGVIGISIYQFILAVIISRFSRFYLISFLLLLYGQSIKIILDKYFNHLGIATIIIVIIYFLLK